VESAVDAIKAGEVDMVINTPYGNSGPRVDGYEIRSAAVSVNIPCITTVQGASAAVQGIEAGSRGDIGVRSLQELHSAIGAQSAGDIGAQSAGDIGAQSAGKGVL
jgi:carbamoyl-phosphate synthase large subunit